MFTKNPSKILEIFPHVIDCNLDEQHRNWTNKEEVQRRELLV